MSSSTRALIVTACVTSLLVATGSAATAATATRPGVEAAAAAPTYDVVAVLDDGDDSPVGRGMNETGTIVGWSGYPLKAFEWDKTHGLTTLPALPGDTHRVASDVNDAGTVVGHSGYETIEPPQHAVRWINGVPEDLGTLPGFADSHAEGINEAGTIVGDSTGGDTHAFVWTESAGMIDITPTARIGRAYDVNESGQVAGYADSRAFVWAKGKRTELGAPAGFTYSAAFAINDDGMVSAQVTSASGNTERAARWSPGVGWEVLGGVGEFAEPWGINSSGTVVGAAGPSFSSRRGFVYLDGFGFLWLNDLLTTPDWNVLDATDIDDDGRILARAHNGATGQTTTVLLAPSSKSVQDEGLRVTLRGSPDPSAGLAKLRVVDEAGSPVQGAVVKGKWAVNGQVVHRGDKDRTDGRGRAALRQRLSDLSGGDVVKFCITDITRGGYTYDPSAPSCDAVTVP